ncbi:MAG TPA: type VII secretion protein EccCa [Actinomycetales bacterium]|nr:type VII secretion protein EccCa [Actinomycetales bacterium]
MIYNIVHRPARTVPVATRPEEIVLAAAPQMGDAPQGFPVQTLLPIVGSMSSITMMVFLRGNKIFVALGAVILVVALVSGLTMAFTSRGAATRRRRTQRERYLDYMERVGEEITAAAVTYRQECILQHPEPAALASLATDPARRWERRRDDPDFLHLRIGTHTHQGVAVSLPPVTNPVELPDPIAQSAAERVAKLGGLVSGLPAVIDISAGGAISVVGEREHALNVVHAALVQTAVLHAPDDVQMAAVLPEGVTDQWRGLDLLPHILGPEIASGAVSSRRIAPSMESLMALMAKELRERVATVTAAKRAGNVVRPPHLIIILDEQSSKAAALPTLDGALGMKDLGITLIHIVTDRLHEPSSINQRIEVTADEIRVSDVDADSGFGVKNSLTAVAADKVSVLLLEAIARPLAGVRLKRGQITAQQIEQAPEIIELMGLTEAADINVDASWAPRSVEDFLRITFGVDDNGAPMTLDIKESAQLGMGPHGICIGATGSGKSELLRTLVLAMAVTHSPADLAMILVDYKGGAAFAPFNKLPHVAGIIDNLADDPQLTQRARSSIDGEVIRRQRLLKEADNSPSITHYRELRRERPELPELPHLFLVIDEFGELLTAEPDFVDLLLTIGRIGRSIGIHLLLSSQRIEAGKLRGLDTYLSYRIGLRTFSESESHVVLETPDAFHLPAIPGFGYLKVDTSIYTRFRAGYVSGPPPVQGEVFKQSPQRPKVVELPKFDIPQARGDEDEVAPQIEELDTGDTLVDVAVTSLSRKADRTRPVWLPPLPAKVTLGEVLQMGEVPPASNSLSIPVGILDAPAQQSQHPWLLDLARSGGHVAVIGAPQSGRSTFLRTLAVSITRSRTPRDISIYGLDLTGSGLARLEGFPHVGGVATRGNRQRQERLLEELTGMLNQREELFAAAGVDSLDEMRRRHARGEIPGLVSADIVLLIDGVGAMRDEFEDLFEPFANLLSRGGSFGLHVVMSLGRWGELRTSLQSLVGTRIELKLNDAGDSQIARKLSETLRADEPGRALTDEELFGQIALPLLENVGDQDLGEAIARLASATAEQWRGEVAPQIRQLPTELSPATLPDPLEEPDLIPVGLRQDTMEPLLLDPVRKDPHLLVLGDTSCGKTTLLRGIIQGAIDRYSPDDLVVALMDTRSELVEDVPEDYLGGHATSGTMGRQLAESVAVELDKRETQRGLGPRILVIADDFDILAAGGAEPLRPLLPYLASARDLRLNVVATRPVLGASRAMFDPAVQGIRDTGGTVVVMNGDRSEGQILPRLYAQPMVPGRARVVRRGEPPTLVQFGEFVPTRTDHSKYAHEGR